MKFTNFKTIKGQIRQGQLYGKEKKSNLDEKKKREYVKRQGVRAESFTKLKYEKACIFSCTHTHVLRKSITDLRRAPSSIF